MARFGSLYITSDTTSLSFDKATTVTSENHSFGNEVVSQTLEDGSPLVDHIVVLQDELEVVLFVSNSVQQSSQDVYAKLKTIRNSRELCTVYTEHEIYSNMAIESVNAPHEAPNVGVLTITVKFKRVDFTGDSVNTYPVRKFEKLETDGGGSDARNSASENTDIGELNPERVI